MLKPRYSRFSSLVTSPLVLQTLPTGNGFGGSSLKIVQFQALVFSIASNIEPVRSTRTLRPSLLVIEAGKIVLLVLWLWCSIGINFCFDSISSIVGLCTQDV
jgi:hypothetical protein